MWANDLFTSLADDLVQAGQDGVGYIQAQTNKLKDAAVKSVQWIWEALQGDFNEDMTVGQIAANALLGLVPIVDQVLDCRDLIANCKKIKEDSSNATAWLALCLTLIGLFPSLGSAAKGVLKICFLYLRKSAGKVEVLLKPALRPIVAFLSDQRVQRILGISSVKQGLQIAAQGVRKIKGSVNTQALLALFDEAIATLESVVKKISWAAPAGVKTWLAEGLAVVRSIRTLADRALATVLGPLQTMLDDVAIYLEKEALIQAPNHSAQAGQRAVHALLDEIDPNVVRKMSNAKKGLFGEIISDQYMASKGHKNLMPEDRIKRSLNDTPNGRGIDGVYQNANPPPPYVITETKYRSETGLYIDSDGSSSEVLLSTTKDGAKQMSDKWIQRNLADDLKNRELTEKIKKSDYARWLILVGPEGKIEQITSLDGAAKAIGAITP